MLADRATPRMEIPALLLSFILAPAAGVAVAIPSSIVAILLGQSLGVISPDGDPADRGRFLVPLAGIACAGFWLCSLPVLLALQAVKRLSFCTVIPPAVVLPAAALASLALLAGANSDRNPAPWFVTSTLLVVPVTATTATAFWILHCFFTGHRFWAPPLSARTDAPTACP